MFANHRPLADRVIGQYCLLKKKKKIGGRLLGRELRVFSMTSSRFVSNSLDRILYSLCVIKDYLTVVIHRVHSMETLELNKKHVMESTGLYSFKDEHFAARAVPHTADEVCGATVTYSNFQVFGVASFTIGSLTGILSFTNISNTISLWDTHDIVTVYFFGYP